MPAKKQSTSSLDPRWVARIYDKTTGEDFLGLRAVQANITNYLMPGIITITPRARYYAFYSWLLVEYSEKHPKGWSLARFIHRREQIFALANIAFSDTAYGTTRVPGLIGRKRLSKHWQAHREAVVVPLSVDDYIKATYGGYDNYTGVMRSLGLYRSREGRRGLDVLPKGQHLSSDFAKAIQNSTYYQERSRYDTAQEIPRSVLIEYGEKCYLGALAAAPDCHLTLEILFALDAPQILPDPASDSPTRGNMQGTLGLILDMLDQAKGLFKEAEFRKALAYGLCPDYKSYRPVATLQPFLTHWQMFQLREYYVYALYALWVYFLHWLRLEGPQSFDEFCSHLKETVDLTAPAVAIGITIPSRSLDEWALTGWLDTLLDASGISGNNRESRCLAFARQSNASLNEHALYRLLRHTGLDDPPAYVGAAWLLLSTLYMRLSGLKNADRRKAWYWAESGRARRRSLDLFVRDISNHMTTGDSILDTLGRLFRDYIVAQHIITALDKWHQRKANTFHFNYEDGVFEWVHSGKTGFSASRFVQAYNMLTDLGLFEIDADTQSPQLTALGKQTLERVLENCGDQA